MSELLATAFWFTLLVVSWKFWKRTFRDSVRDDLFDIRDKWRRFWIDGGRSLSNPAYARFRGEINVYLRYTSTYRFSDLLYVYKHKRCIKTVLNEAECHEPSADQETIDQIRRLRAKAILSLQAYMVGTSILIFPVLLLTLVAAIVKRISLAVSFCKSTARLANTIPFAQAENFQRAARLQPAST
jgi:hypothetical protein